MMIDIQRQACMHVHDGMHVTQPRGTAWHIAEGQQAVAPQLPLFQCWLAIYRPGTAAWRPRTAGTLDSKKKKKELLAGKYIAERPWPSNQPHATSPKQGDLTDRQLKHHTSDLYCPAVLYITPIYVIKMQLPGFLSPSPLVMHCRHLLTRSNVGLAAHCPHSYALYPSFTHVRHAALAAAELLLTIMQFSQPQGSTLLVLDRHDWHCCASMSLVLYQAQ